VIADVRQMNGITVVDIEGRFDAVSASKTKARLHELIAAGHTRLLLNLQGMDFIDSEGLGVLVSCLRRTALENGTLRLADVPPFCRSIFELTGLTRVFDVTRALDQTLRAMAQEATDRR